MIKRLPVRRLILIILPILLAGIISFSQAIQIPLEQGPAERVLAAWNILQGNIPLTGWKFHPLELPVYLVSVLVFRLSTYASVTASEIFYMIIFCSGLLILSAHRMLTPVSCLIWFAAAGTPDQALVRNVQKNPMLFIGILYFLYFLSKLTERKIHGSETGSAASEEKEIREPGRKHDSSGKITAGLAGSLVVLIPALKLPVKIGNFFPGMHETLRMLQKVFRADFSRQPLFRLYTIRYFLNSVILLLILFVMCRVILICACRRRLLLPQLIYAAAIFLTLMLSSWLFGLPEKELLCSWILFGGGILLSTAYESSALPKLRFMEYRIPFSAAAALFFAAAICFRIEPAVTSRPQGPADKAAAFLQGHELMQGSCAPEDIAVLTTASKGKIRFTDDADDPDNRFSVFRKETKPESPAGEIYETDPYLILIYP